MPLGETGILGRVSTTTALRTVKFAAVGVVCFGIQYVLLVILVRFVMTQQHTLANAIAFMVSAQVNFLLSRIITWRDRLVREATSGSILIQGFKYNATALSSLGVNSLVFWTVDNLTGSLFLAVGFGNGVGMVFTFLVLNRLVFRPITSTEM